MWSRWRRQAFSVGVDNDLEFGASLDWIKSVGKSISNGCVAFGGRQTEGGKSNL